MAPSRLLSWFLRHRSALLMWAVLASTFALTYATYVRWYRMFYPDSRYYLAMAYLFLGNDPDAARELTVDYAAPRNIDVPPVSDLFGWGLVQPRVVLPALSAPFIALFGPAGLAVVPLLATFAFLIIAVVMLRRRFGTLVALLIGLLVSTSLFLVSIGTGMLTEGLSALFTALALLLTWRWLERRRPWLLVAIGGVTVLSAFTRQATLIMAGAFISAWVLGSLIERRNSRLMWPALIVGIAAVGCQVIQMLVFPSFSQLDQFLAQAGADTLGEALLNVPRMALDIVRADVLTMLRGDRSLLVLICLAVVGMILFWRRFESHLLLGAIAATAVYNITNGTPTQFRYATPGLIFWMLAAGMLVAATVTWIRSSRNNPTALPGMAEDPADDALVVESSTRDDQAESTSITRRAADPSP
ncbi:glycosyltransferase family 39 protein [Microbacterium hydrocarbonoxydans]|uniref:glycosyltransferase family 39 protein n=1 Tax=Microbacterium hydrocarbonoxydans TaxID=273678 RepID=UPI0013D9E864|nr:glycosyltransferase family 39 protein [Microbacterium hydrocarbonoxydans]